MAVSAETSRQRLDEQLRTLELLREMEGQLGIAEKDLRQLKAWAEGNPLGMQSAIPKESREWRAAKAELGRALAKAEELRGQLP